MIKIMDSILRFVEEISTKFVEDQENFIFETIRPFCEERTQMKISKQELVSALLFWRNKDKMISEIENLNTVGFVEDDVFSTPKPMIWKNEVMDIINKYCKENKS
jgi:hypothetical protein